MFHLRPLNHAQRSYAADTTPISCRHHNRGVNLLVLKQTVLGVAI